MQNPKPVLGTDGRRNHGKEAGAPRPAKTGDGGRVSLALRGWRQAGRVSERRPSEARH